MYIGNYEMQSPIMNAGGVVKTVRDTELMARTGVGAVLAGSYTLEPRIGNSPNGEVVYHHDPQTGATYNSLGMPNKGLEYVAQELPAMLDVVHSYGKPLILNLAPVSDDPVGEIVSMAEILAKHNVRGIDAIELNASCPNVITADDGRHELLSHHPDLLHNVLLELQDIRATERAFNGLFVRISPFRDQHDVYPLVDVLTSAGVDAVSAFNTFPGKRPVDANNQPILQVKGGMGGQSGKAMAQVAEQQTWWLMQARDQMESSFDVIGSNGIADAHTMKRRFDLEVSAVSATTLFYESPHWPSAVHTLLEQYAALVEPS